MRTRKILRFLLTFLILLTIYLCPKSASAETLTTDDGFSYTKTQILSSYVVTITGYTGDASVLEIPETIEDYTVTEIAISAFEGNTNLTSVVFPSGLKTIRSMVCQNCTNLTDVTFTSTNYLSFGTYVFNGCTSLKNVTFSSKISAIKEGTFADCTSLEVITLPSATTTILNKAFENSTFNFCYFW